MHTRTTMRDHITGCVEPIPTTTMVSNSIETMVSNPAPTIGALVRLQPHDESVLEELKVFTTNPKGTDYWDVYNPNNQDDVNSKMALKYCVEKSIQVLLRMRPGQDIGTRLEEMEQAYWNRNFRRGGGGYDYGFEEEQRRWLGDYDEEVESSLDSGTDEVDNDDDEEVESLDSGMTGTDDDEDNNQELSLPDLHFESLDSKSGFKSEISFHPLFCFSDDNTAERNIQKFRVLSHVFDSKSDNVVPRIMFYDNTYSMRGRTLTRHVTSLIANQGSQIDYCKGWGINKIFWDNIEHKVKMNYLDAFVVEMILQTQTIRALLKKMASPANPSDHKCRWHFTTTKIENGANIDFEIISQNPMRVRVISPTQVQVKQNWLLNLLRYKRGSLSQHIATLKLDAKFTKSLDVREQPAALHVKTQRYVRTFDGHGHDFEDPKHISHTHRRHKKTLVQMH
jgi:hypothetical protein